ncbi:MAG TPA: tetratricopeptide repeat protein [Vicinamibacterales bacterium]|nr:tetratricopeptide repeat protein [Vicinamibacterales bacterium]
MTHHVLAVVFVALGFASGAFAQTDPAALVKEGQKLENAGQFEEALAIYRKVAGAHPDRFDAHLGMGRVLDLRGNYTEARTHLQQAITLAPEASRNQALAAMAVSYAFEGNAAGAAKYYQQVFDRQMKEGSPGGAAGVANALGRVYLETGDTASAEKWYRTGYETSKTIEKLSPEDADLWEMRWQHAQGRIAARRGQADAARTHIEGVRAIVARGRLDEEQRSHAPHLAGYVALYLKEYDAAIAELSKADQTDPFILGLLAQAYEAKKEVAKARDLYAQILEMPGHILQVAFSRPLAQRRLAAM